MAHHVLGRCQFPNGHTARKPLTLYGAFNHAIYNKGLQLCSSRSMPSILHEIDIRNFHTFRGTHRISLKGLKLTTVLGQNGTGKSTMSTAMEVAMGSSDIEKLNEEDSHIQLLFEDNNARYSFYIDSNGRHKVNNSEVTRDEYLKTVNRIIRAQQITFSQNWRKISNDPHKSMDYLISFYYFDDNLKNNVDNCKHFDRSEYEDVCNELNEMLQEEQNISQDLRKFSFEHTDQTVSRYAKKVKQLNKLKASTLKRQRILEYQLLRLEIQHSKQQAEHWEIEKRQIESSIHDDRTEESRLKKRLELLNSELSISEREVRSLEDSELNRYEELLNAQWETYYNLIFNECRSTRVDFLDLINAECDKSALSVQSTDTAQTFLEILCGDCRNIMDYTVYLKHSIEGTIQNIDNSDKKFQEFRNNSESELHELYHSQDQLQIILSDCANDSDTCGNDSSSEENSFETHIRLEYPEIIGNSSDFLIPIDGVENSFPVTRQQLRKLYHMALQRKISQFFHHLNGTTKHHIYVVPNIENALNYSRCTREFVFIPLFCDPEQNYLPSRAEQLDSSIQKCFPEMFVLSQTARTGDAHLQNLINFALDEFLVVQSSVVAKAIIKRPDLYPVDMIICDYNGVIYPNKGQPIVALQAPESSESKEKVILQKELQDRITEYLECLLLDQSLHSSCLHRMRIQNSCLNNWKDEFLQVQTTLEWFICSISIFLDRLQTYKDISLIADLSMQDIISTCQSKIRTQSENMQREVPKKQVFSKELLTSVFESQIEMEQSTSLQSAYQKLNGLKVALFESMPVLKWLNHKIVSKQGELAAIDQLSEDLHRSLTSLEAKSQDYGTTYKEAATKGQIFDAQHPDLLMRKITAIKSQLIQTNSQLQRLDNIGAVYTTVNERNQFRDEDETEKEINDFYDIQNKLKSVKRNIKEVSAKKDNLKHQKFGSAEEALKVLEDPMQNCYNASYAFKNRSPKQRIYMNVVDIGDIDQGIFFRAIPIAKTFICLANLSTGEFLIASISFHIGLAEGRGAKLLLIDEFDAHLDRRRNKSVKKLFQTVIKKHNCPFGIIYATHSRRMQKQADQYVGVYKYEESTRVFVYVETPGKRRRKMAQNKRTKVNREYSPSRNFFSLPNTQVIRTSSPQRNHNLLFSQNFSPERMLSTPLRNFSPGSLPHITFSSQDHFILSFHEQHQQESGGHMIEQSYMSPAVPGEHLASSLITEERRKGSQCEVSSNTEHQSSSIVHMRDAVSFKNREAPSKSPSSSKSESEMISKNPEVEAISPKSSLSKEEVSVHEAGSLQLLTSPSASHKTSTRLQRMKFTPQQERITKRQSSPIFPIQRPVGIPTMSSPHKIETPIHENSSPPDDIPCQTPSRIPSSQDASDSIEMQDRDTLADQNDVNLEEVRLSNESAQHRSPASIPTDTLTHLQMSSSHKQESIMQHHFSPSMHAETPNHLLNSSPDQQASSIHRHESLSAFSESPHHLQYMSSPIKDQSDSLENSSSTPAQSPVLLPTSQRSFEDSEESVLLDVKGTSFDRKHAQRLNTSASLELPHGQSEYPVPGTTSTVLLGGKTQSSIIDRNTSSHQVKASTKALSQTTASQDMREGQVISQNRAIALEHSHSHLDSASGLQRTGKSNNPQSQSPLEDRDTWHASSGTSEESLGSSERRVSPPPSPSTSRIRFPCSIQ